MTSTARQRVLRELAQWLRAHPVLLGHRQPALRVGIDGVDGAGKTTFADELAEELAEELGPGNAVVRAGTDHFLAPRAERYRRGNDSPDGFYLDSHDHAAVRDVLLAPLGPGGDGRIRRAVFDHRSDTPLTLETEPWQQVEPPAILVFDGIFLQHPALAGLLDAVVFLQVSTQVSVARCAARDGSDPDPAAVSNRRYVLGQQRYLRERRPAETADVVVDNDDPDAPDDHLAPLMIGTRSSESPHQLPDPAISRRSDDSVPIMGGLLVLRDLVSA